MGPHVVRRVAVDREFLERRLGETLAFIKTLTDPAQRTGHSEIAEIYRRALTDWDETAASSRPTTEGKLTVQYQSPSDS